jgi:hypothetical protein
MEEAASIADEKSQARPAVAVVGVPDLDRPIYRIFPLWFFEQALAVC